MDLDELPSAGLPDLDDSFELFPEVTQAENAQLDLLPFDSELASSVTAASPAALSTTTSQPGDDIPTPAPADPKPAPKKAPAKKKAVAAKKPPSSNASAAALKKTKAVPVATTTVVKTVAPRRPKTKPAGAVNGIAPGNGCRSGTTSTGNDSDDPGTYCLCRGRDDHRWMICCEKCEDWFHGECINMDKETGENLIEMFVCPGCTDGETLVTRFKKMCSFSGCRKPARSYLPAVAAADEEEKDAGESSSVFCSDEHCQAWWEQVIARLPAASSIPPAIVGRLSREDLLGVISSGLGYIDETTGTYKICRVPFSNALALDGENAEAHLTMEEKELLAQSAADQKEMADESELYAQMITLLERAGDRHKAAVAAGYIANDICGYDHRLDTLSAEAAFSAFLATNEGTAALAGEELQPPLNQLPAIQELEDNDERSRRMALAGMCDRKRCKAHSGWLVMFGRTLRAQIRQLADQAQELMNEEEVIREAAMERVRRKETERNRVETVGEVKVKTEAGMELD